MSTFNVNKQIQQKQQEEETQCRWMTLHFFYSPLYSNFSGLCSRHS
jgi:hypothetical protein